MISSISLSNETSKSMAQKEIQLNKLYPTLKFLIIDDFESFRSSLRLMLSSFGAQQVDMASTAEDAINKCQYEYYDVILCDFNLGSGKNGQQILEELRFKKRLKHTHLFVMITAETAKDVVLGAKEYQPDGYIAKPITRTVLEQRLGHLLKQQKRLKPINKEIDLENYTKAISLCHEMIEQGESKYKSWCLQTLAKLYAKVGDTAHAEQIYRDTLSSREISWARLGLAQVLNQEQKYKEAEENFKNVIDNNPNIVEAYDGLSHSYIKMGKNKEAQEALQEAVTLSPRMVPRQEKLGDISHKNQDIESATNAFRMAIQYGENSVHEKPDHYLELGRCISDWVEGDTSDKGKELAKEAVAILTKASHKYSNNDDACINALLIESRIHAGQNKPELCDKKLHQAESMLDEDDLSPEVGLELAKSLYAAKQEDRAEKLLIKLSQQFSDQPDILAKIETLMDEPESLAKRIKAKEHNKSGISLFEQNNLDGAIDSFSKALEFTPKHAALNLNLVQVLLKQYRQEKQEQSLILAKTALDRINHIPEQHHQFKRLQHLKTKLNKIASNT